MTAFRWGLAALLIVAAAVAWVAAWTYRRDMAQAYQRIEGPSESMTWDDGVRMVWRAGGQGLPVLVVHGSGGGWDQGELVAQAVLGEGLRWIAPSRMGYLGASLPAGATFDTQADLFARLLDHLKIERVAVVALSHGGPSALLFALRHPQRVASLVLVSCGVASAADATQSQADVKGRALTTIFSHDPLYWGVSTLARPALLRLMGADAAVVATLDAERLALVDRVIGEMNPVAPRSPGVVLDHHAALPGPRIAGIKAPTLVLHARDDGLQLFRNAEFAAAAISGARLQAYDRGGHLLLAVERDAVRHAATAFIQAHALKP